MDLSQLIKGVGIVAGAFNPAVGSGIVALSSVLKNVDDVDLENTEGLSAISKGIKDMVETNNIDSSKLLEYSKMLDDIVLILEKNIKLIK